MAKEKNHNNIIMSGKEQCRTCLCTNREMRNVHTSITIAGDNVKLTDILQNFYSYKLSSIDDVYPDTLCINCVTQLTMTYSFKVLIENSLKTLSETYNSSYSHNKANYDNEYDSDDIKPIVNISVKRKRRIKSEIQKELLFCVVCKAHFNSKKSLLSHCSSSHPNNQDVGKKCDYCNEMFEDFRSLVLHGKLHQKPYLCENCWEGFLSTEELNSHLCQPKSNRGRDRLKSGQVLQQCDQCGKSYPNRYMRVHKMIHGNDLKYSCNYCSKKFKVPGSLNSHILWNHKRTRDHKCEVCNATFISASSKSTHIRKLHLKEKKYACEGCTKRFFSKSELEKHMLTHTGVKNFHCQLCNKSYQTRSGLNVHLKSHSLNVNVISI